MGKEDFNIRTPAAAIALEVSIMLGRSGYSISGKAESGILTAKVDGHTYKIEISEIE